MDKYTGSSYREYTPEFKARVALEALKERKSQRDLAEEFEVHSARVCEWRKELLDHAKNIFIPKGREGDEKEKISKLYQQIGELTYELEWLKKKFQGLA